MKKILFIDRDGTLIVEPPITYQIDSFEKLSFLPGVIKYLGKIAETKEYELVMVTNQDGLGTASFPEKDFWPVQNLLIDILKGEGIEFKEVCIDKSFESENLPTRKPGIAMLTNYLNGDYDLKNSFVIGDRHTDVQLAKNLGAKAIRIGSASEQIENCITISNWKEIYDFLALPNRWAIVERRTNETKIKISIDLDGKGKAEIKTGLSFFNHMLEQIAKHGSLDLSINAIGDLHIDEHHTIEDVGIALGECFVKALGDKSGIERYGFLLPMDDCLAQVAIDFGGRPWIVWDAEFKREKVGDMPTEMFFHFFKSFSDAAKCNLNIKAEGTNEHHKIESIFKAFAKAIKMAKSRDVNNMQLPSTKGML